MKTRVTWIDLAKTMAILAVLLDHTYSRVYHSEKIWSISYFSVSVFILCMGITTYWSYEKSQMPLYRKAIGKIKSILIPYVCATVIYYVVFTKSFDAEEIVNYLIHFNMSGPFYYVALYISLVLATPVIFSFLNWNCRLKKLKNMIGFIVVAGSCIFLVNCTNIYGILAAGGMLFGGTFLIVLYFGMWMAPWLKTICLPRNSAVLLSLIALTGAAAWLSFWRITDGAVDRIIPYGGAMNPPGPGMIIYALLIFLGGGGIRRSNLCKQECAGIKSIHLVSEDWTA